MEIKLTILKPFFEDPNKKHSIRELSRVLNINHTTVRQHLNNLEKEDILSRKKEGVYTNYRLVLSRKTLNLKLYYNLEKIRISNIIEDLDRYYDLPTIVIFGSYAQATDDTKSDIDICIISNVDKEFPTEKYEKDLNKRISIHKFTKERWIKTKKLNPNLINSICNGIVIANELEVI